MWLLGRSAPDLKTVADFRRRNGAAFVAVSRAFVKFCARAKLLGGELVAIDGSKFQAASSKRRVVTARSLEEESRRLDGRIAQYLESLDAADREEEPEEEVDGEAVAAALRAQAELGTRTLCVVADAGYSNAAQFVACEQAGITPYVPPNRSGNSEGGGKHYPASSFTYDATTDTCRCPAGKVLKLMQVHRTQLHRVYAARPRDCEGCRLKPQCTRASRRLVPRHWHEEAFERMAQRLAATPGMMARRRSLAEHPFGQIKWPDHR